MGNLHRHAAVGMSQLKNAFYRPGMGNYGVVDDPFAEEDKNPGLQSRTSDMRSRTESDASSDTPWNKAANVRAQLQEELKRERPLGLDPMSPKMSTRQLDSGGTRKMTGSSESLHSNMEGFGANPDQKRDKNDKHRHRPRRTRAASNDSHGEVPPGDETHGAPWPPAQAPAPGDSQSDPFFFPGQPPKAMAAQDRPPHAVVVSPQIQQATPSSNTVWPAARYGRPPEAQKSPVQSWPSPKAQIATPMANSNVNLPWTPMMDMQVESQPQTNMNAKPSSVDDSTPRSQNSPVFPSAEALQSPRKLTSPDSIQTAFRPKDPEALPSGATLPLLADSSPSSSSPIVDSTDPHESRRKQALENEPEPIGEPAPGRFDEAILAALAALPQDSLVDVLRRLAQKRPSAVAQALGTQPAISRASSACETPSPVDVSSNARHAQPQPNAAAPEQEKVYEPFLEDAQVAELDGNNHASPTTNVLGAPPLDIQLDAILPPASQDLGPAACCGGSSGGVPAGNKPSESPGTSQSTHLESTANFLATKAPSPLPGVSQSTNLDGAEMFLTPMGKQSASPAAPFSVGSAVSRDMLQPPAARSTSGCGWPEPSAPASSPITSSQPWPTAPGAQLQSGWPPASPQQPSLVASPTTQPLSAEIPVGSASMGIMPNQAPSSPWPSAATPQQTAWMPSPMMDWPADSQSAWPPSTK